MCTVRNKEENKAKVEISGGSQSSVSLGGRKGGKRRGGMGEGKGNGGSVDIDGDIFILLRPF